MTVGRQSAPSFWVVIPAAGVGARMQADRPKQYLELAGRCLLEHTLDCFLGHPGLKGLVVCLAAEDPYWPTLACAKDARIHRAAGGSERADSVLSGLQALEALGAAEQDWVLVHDAARPNLAPEDLALLLGELAADPVGGLLAAPSRDTLKRARPDGRVLETVDRSHIWQAFTPQMFHFGRLRQALRAALQVGAAITDEASAIELAGHAPRLIEGRADNLKITRPEDLEWLRLRWASKPAT
ncbi:2-C-methyl-D-erythritol 4-phosphate cytidylyltransferase [Pseudomonas sp. N040]|uniref:2-C-methyl-D-erythritol 4-phosphate cytidylyltransferase n=1 Tax=Pseudomonas sp. N040 TaxID=2785325 RepID=UPI0018A28023|nr:2-C-methyl-D-erythritol 4-phosphate cytidylyltransferase [Pseudomonas sp. N040]MBF7729721.1 2-C-methyl-D-erythritol 4-phosphate cytidylyltransferase [Pseudomonas sp. N040]MBW7013363.1 2-C-methyl-D-erythritol 4-phosphate cytidylyltransferase [Pseudomonas sp. N040]